MTASGDDPRWRRCVLAVSVLDDLDAAPTDRGVLVAGTRSVLVPWPELIAEAGTADPGGPVARFRVGAALRLRSLVADLGEEAAATLAGFARPLALPPGHVLHPGPAWRMNQVRGGALDLGVGLFAVPGIAASSTLAVPLPPSVAALAGIEPRHWWAGIRGRLERAGTSAADRLRRDGALDRDRTDRRPLGRRAPFDRDPDPGGQVGPRAAVVLRPVGGCDPLTLLGSHALRAAIAAADGTGLRTVAVPTRERGWFDARQLDPAYVRTAWHLTAEAERGLDVPLLVSRDEVCLPRAARVAERG